MAQKKPGSSTSSSRTGRSASKGGKSKGGKSAGGKSGTGKPAAGGKSGPGGSSSRKRTTAAKSAGSRSAGRRRGVSGGAGKSGSGAPRGGLPRFDGRALRMVAIAVSVTLVVGVALGLVIGLRVAGSDHRDGRSAAVRDDGKRIDEGTAAVDDKDVPSERYPEEEEAEVAAGRGEADSPDRTEDGAEAGGKKPPAGEKEPPPAKPIPLYVVIDDVGNSLAQLDPFLETGLPITYAVLPLRVYSGESARRIVDAGQEIILHQPMEAENGNDPGAGAILTSLGGMEIEKLLADNLRSVPGVIGVNNHMGSKVTADEKTMDTVLRYLGGKGLFFLDSRTTAATVGKAIAEKHSVSFAERHVFLDNEPNRDYIRQAVEQGMDIARRRGHAVLIGHVMVTEVAEVLEEMYPFIRDEGFDLHHLSDLVLGPPDDGSWD
ncbi:MAG: divergent polysaccharide deacetylase family protein [Spirochaetaceae bacterium]